MSASCAPFGWARYVSPSSTPHWAEVLRAFAVHIGHDAGPDRQGEALCAAPAAIQAVAVEFGCADTPSRAVLTLLHCAPEADLSVMTYVRSGVAVGVALRAHGFEVPQA